MFKGNDISQLYLFGQCLDDKIEKDHPARDYLKFAQMVPLSMFDVRGDDSGKAQYDPRHLLALCAYAYSKGQYSSRQIEEMARETFAGQFIMGGCEPSHMTICRFLRDNVEAILRLNQDIIDYGVAEGLVSADHLIIDGHKMHASANKDRSIKYKHYPKVRKKLRDKREELVTELKSLSEQLENVKDDDDFSESKSVGKELRAILKKIQQLDRRIVGLEVAKKNLEDEAVQKAEDGFEREREKGVLNIYEKDVEIVYKLSLERDIVVAQREQLEKEVKQDKKDNLWSGEERSAKTSELRKLKIRESAKAGAFEKRKAELSKELVPKFMELATKELTEEEKQRKEFLIRNARPGRNKRMNSTDPDSRMMHHHNNSHPQSYNLQLAIDKNSRVALYAHFTRDENDLYQLRPCVEHVSKHTGKVSRIDADIGFHVHHELEMLMVLGVDCGVPGNHKTATQIKKTGQAKYAKSRSETSDFKERVTFRSIIEGLFGDLSHNDRMRFLYYRGLEKVQNIIILKIASNNIQRTVKIQNQALEAARLKKEECQKAAQEKERAGLKTLLKKSKEYLHNFDCDNPELQFA